MTPKSLLRLEAARSNLSEMDVGSDFRRLIPEEGSCAQNPENVKKLIFCTGKIYYEILKERDQRGLSNDIAISRIEQVSYSDLTQHTSSRRLHTYKSQRMNFK